MDDVDWERREEEHQQAVRELCWRFADLARSRKTGAIVDLAFFIAGLPPSTRQPWTTRVKYWIRNTIQ